MQIKLATDTKDVTDFMSIEAAAEFLEEATERGEEVSCAALMSEEGCVALLFDGVTLTPEGIEHLEEAEGEGDTLENAYVLYVGDLGTTPELPSFDEATGHFYGAFDSLADFAEAITEEMYSAELANLPYSVRNAIDWGKVGAGMPAKGHYTILDAKDSADQQDATGDSKIYCWTA